MITTIRIVFALFALVLVSVALMPVQLLFLWLKHPWRNRLPGVWHRIALRLLGIRVHVHGGLEPRRPLLVVANHVSWLDILVLAAVADVTYVAKSEVKDWPVFGTLAQLQRSIFIARDNRRRTQDQANDMADRMNAGETVVLFPEGTTSDGNRLWDTKSSLMAAAITAATQSASGRVYVQPTAVAYTRIHGMPMGHYHRPIVAWPGDVELMPHLMGVLKAGALDVEVHFGEAIEVTPQSNRKTLSLAADAQIRERLEAALHPR